MAQVSAIVENPRSARKKVKRVVERRVMTDEDQTGNFRDDWAGARELPRGFVLVRVGS